MLSQQIISRPTRPSMSAREMLMPFTLTVRVSGFNGLPEEKIQQLERKLTEFFFHAPQRYDGTLSIYLDMYGDMSHLYRRMQLFFFGLRGAIVPALNFDVNFYYGQNS